MSTASPAPPAQPRRRRRVVRIAVLVIATLVALVLVAVLVLHTPPARRLVLARVAEALRAQRIGLEAANLRYNLLDLSVALDDVQLRSQQWPDGPTFATIRHVDADLSLQALLRGRYVVQSARVDGLELHYVVEADGRHNLPTPPEREPSSDAPLDYLIEDAEITDAVVRYESRAQDLDLRLPVPRLTVRGHADTRRHDVRLAAADGELRAGARRLAIERLEGDVDLGQDDVRIGRLQLVTPAAQAELSGTIADFAAPTADLAARLRGDLAQAARVAGVTAPVGGTLDVEATARGPFTALDANATLAGRAVRYGALDGIALDAQARYLGAAQRVDLPSLRLRAPFGGLDAQGSLALVDTGTTRVAARLLGLDAGAVTRALDLPYVVATRVDGDLAASFPGFDYARAAGEATLALAATERRASLNVVPVAGRLHARAAGGAARVDSLALGALGAQVTGSVAVGRAADDSTARAMDGRLRLAADDLGATLAAVERLLGRRAGSLAPAPTAGALRAELVLEGTTAAPRAVGWFESPSLTVGPIGGAVVHGDLRYDPSVLRLSRLEASWQSTELAADATVGLTAARPLDARLRAEGLDVATLLGLAGRDDVPAAGRLDLQATASGSVDAPQAHVTVIGTGLQAYGEALGTLRADAALTGREVVLEALALDKPQADGDARVTASGRYHLDRRDAALDLRSDGLRVLSMDVPGAPAVRGPLDLEAHVRGPLASPQGTVTVSSAALEVDGRALGRVAATADLAGGRARVTTTAEQFALQARADIGLNAPYPTQLEARLDGLDLTRLPVELDTPLTGTLRARVEGTADLSAPRDGRATVTVDGFEGAWNGHPFAVSAPAVLRYADARLAIDALRLTAEETTVALQGDLPLDAAAAPGTITLDARANLASLAQYAPAGTAVTAAGDLALTGTVRGTLQAVDPTLTLTIDRGAFAWADVQPGVTDLTARLTVGDGVARLETLQGAWGAARLDASATAPLDLLPELPVAIPRRGGPAEGTLRLTGLDLATVPGAPEGLSGVVSVTADARAPRPDLASLDARVTLPEFQAAFEGLTLAQVQPTTMRIAEGAATVEQFRLEGSVGTLSARGTAGLLGDRPVDLAVEGNLNLAALGAVTDAARVEGAARLDVRAAGTMAAPDLSGVVEVHDGRVAVDEPRIAAQHLEARLDLAGPRVTLAALSADVNGGTLTGSGAVTLGAGGLEDVDLQFATTDFAFDAPLDLRSLSDAAIRVSRQGDDFVVGGQVTIKEAGLTGDINFDTGLLATVNRRKGLDLTEERNPLIERVRLGVDVDTATPILVDNNLARAEITADLRVLGTPYDLGLSGRLTVEEGGEITLNERRYQVVRGDITFLGERQILPSFDLQMTAAVSNYDITLGVSGVPGETETTLIADPPLPEPDIMALLVTGRTLEAMRGEEYDVAREQVLSYLTGRLGSTLGRSLQRATGLSEVRVEPNLIASEQEPSARLTVGQDLTDQLSLVYSTSLANSSDQIWVAEYDLSRHFQTRAVRQSDNSLRVDFRHDVRFGGEPPPRRQPRTRPRVSAVDVTGELLPSEAQVRDWLGVSPGKEYDYFAVRDGIARIEREYVDRGHLQARVRLTRTMAEQSAALRVEVTAGPRVDLRVTGVDLPGDVAEEIRTKWHRGVFDTQRADDVSEALRGWLMDEDYLQPEIRWTVTEPQAGSRLAEFQVVRGPRYRTVRLAFEGARGIAPEELEAVVADQGLQRQLFTDATLVTELLEKVYREQGYLAARVEAPRIRYEGDRADVVVPVQEGPRFVVGAVTASGTRAVTSESLLRALPLAQGQPFLPSVAERALTRVRQVYWQRGYNDVRADYTLTPDREAATVAVAFTVTEGPQAMVADVRIAGNEATSDRLVRQQLELPLEAPLDLAALSRSRRNLYETGAFSVVDIVRHPLGAEVGTTGSDAAPADGSADTEQRGRSAERGAESSVGTDPAPEKPVRIDVTVREVQPYQLRYGASFDTERGLGGIFDLSARNVLGKARVVGVRSRYDAQLREARGFLSQPSLRYWPVQITGSLYYREERNPGTSTVDPLDVDRVGASVQNEIQLRNRYVLSAGARWERVRTYDEPPGSNLDPLTVVSPLSATITRELRDDVLDTTRGSFLSQAFEYSPSWLGADAAYMRYLGQYFRYLPLRPDRRDRLTGEVRRTRFVYATGVRVGLAHGLGGDVPRSEKFFAGGSTTLRGFEQNGLGYSEAERRPSGGQALFVLNNELRFPLAWVVDGVGFVDIGNVFPSVSAWDFGNLRETAGVGVRVHTPWFLLRGDYGMILDRRPGESRGRFYFSIGQAF